MKISKIFSRFSTKVALVLTTAFAANVSTAQDVEPTLIPIGVGDITTFIPMLAPPSNVQVSGNADSRHITWNPVNSASYYQILIEDENGNQTSIRVVDTDYDLAGLPLGESTVTLLACNANDQCGATANIGTYNTTERVTYVHADFLGSPILKTDTAGNKVAEFHYKPFGETQEEKKEEVGYTGHLEDTDLDLTYMQARYYDPHIGRFYGNDPVDAFAFVSQGNVHGFNRYAYANNNPYKYVDPDGENPYWAGEVNRRENLGQNNWGWKEALIGTAIPLATVGAGVGASACYLSVVCGLVVNGGMFIASGDPADLAGGLGSGAKVAKSGSGAVNNATKPLLNRQLSAQEIANGHAFEKHVLQQGQFPFIKTKKQFADHLESVMANPTHHKQLGGGREAFYDSKTSTFIVRNPKDPDGGSAFQESLDYFNRQN